MAPCLLPVGLAGSPWSARQVGQSLSWRSRTAAVGGTCLSQLLAASGAGVGLCSEKGGRSWEVLGARSEIKANHPALFSDQLRQHWDSGLLCPAALACNQPQALSLIGALLSPGTRPEQPGRWAE